MSADACHCCHATFAECGYPDWICCPDCSHRPTPPEHPGVAALLRRCDECDEAFARGGWKHGMLPTSEVRALLGGADNNNNKGERRG